MPNGCYMCKCKEESIYHLLHCFQSNNFVAIGLFFVWCGWVMHSTFRESSKFAWFVCGEETEKSLEGCSLVLVLDFMEGKK